MLLLFFAVRVVTKCSAKTEMLTVSTLYVQPARKNGRVPIKVARQMESAQGTKLAFGEVGIRKQKLAPTLAEFLRTTPV